MSWPQVRILPGAPAEIRAIGSLKSFIAGPSDIDMLDSREGAVPDLFHDPTSPEERSRQRAVSRLRVCSRYLRPRAWRAPIGPTYGSKLRDDYAVECSVGRKVQ
jgi:hypothetical protein